MTIEDNIVEDAAQAAFVKAQSVYRADHDHFPLKQTWETTSEGVREGWRSIAYAALEAADTPPFGTQPEPRNSGRFFGVGDLWQELIEKDDRTSPEEYPDMALISFAEFSEFIRRARSPFDKATMDLCANWGRFCDADPFDGADTFTDRMEAAGLIELVPVDDEALEQSFAAERGIEPGGTMWVLTDIGQQAVNASAP